MYTTYNILGVLDDVQDESQSSLRDKMEANEFIALQRICKQYTNHKHQPSSYMKANNRNNRNSHSKYRKQAKSQSITKIDYQVPDWINKQNQTREIYLSQCPLLIGAEKDNTLMNTATLGRHNNIPLITYFVDTYNRYRVNNAFNSNDNDDIKDNDKELNNTEPMKFINGLPFYKQLYDSDKKGTKVHSILETYQARFAPKIQLNPDINDKFNDNIEDTLRYIYGVSQMLESIIAAKRLPDNVEDEDDIIPFQFDLVIIPHGGKNNSNKDIENQYAAVVDDDSDDDGDDGTSSDDDDDDDDDDEEEEYGDGTQNDDDKDKIGKIITRLKKYDIKAAMFEIEQKTLKTNASAQIKRKFNEQFKSVRKGRHGRYVMIVDRREEEKDNDNDNDDDEDEKGYNNDKHGDDDEKEKKSNDKIYIYSPKCEIDGGKKKKNCYHKIHKNFVDESLIYKTTKCLIPGLDEEINDPHLGCNERGLITLSFHVLSTELIKCYLYLNGGGTRFEPIDLITILPRHFKKGAPSKSSLLDEQQLKHYFPLKLKDEKFYSWFKQTTQKKPNINHGR